MIDRFRDIARALVAVLLLGMAGAAAQTAQSPTSPNPSAASQAGSVPTAQAPAQPAGPAGPQINTDAMPQNMDWLREAVAEYVSRSHNGSGSGNGKAYGTPQVSP
jgi:hypothetical protein